MTFKRFEIEFFTATILEWKHLLQQEKYKLIIIESLDYLVQKERIHLVAFVLMNNHIHLLWQIREGNTREAIQRDFLKFTAQRIIMDLKKNHPEVLAHFHVGAKDRQYQIWERNALSVSIWTEAVFFQKLEYIHQNPVRAGLCMRPEEYLYFSAAFYKGEKDQFGIVKHILD